VLVLFYLVLGTKLAQVLVERIGIGALVHQGQQLGFALGQVFQRALKVAGAVALGRGAVALLQQAGFFGFGVATGLQQSQQVGILLGTLGFGQSALVALAVVLTQLLGEFLALPVPGQYRHHFGGEAFALLHQMLPALVVADLVL